MGLDQYLSGRIYLSEFDKEQKEMKKKVGKHFPDIKFEVESIKFKVFQWRKANAIHKWFVDNVQEGNDDCRSYYVDLEQLQELLDIINKVLGKDLNNKEKIVDVLCSGLKERAQEFLPSSSGFFFGDTEYDEYYINDLRETKEMLEDIFKNKDKYEWMDFEYSSSW